MKTIPRPASLLIMVLGLGSLCGCVSENEHVHDRGGVLEQHEVVVPTSPTPAPVNGNRP